MSRYMIIGGAIGFLVAAISGLVSGHPLNVIMRDAMIGCLILALIAKFFYQNLEKGVIAVLEKEIEELQENALTNKEESSASKSKKAK